MNETLKSAMPIISLVVGYIVKGVVAALKFADENQEEIAAIIKRVEADTSDGHWTADEKKYLAWDLFKKHLYPKLPWYVQVLPERVLKDKFFAVVEKIVEKARDMKKDAPTPV